jgi:hypothetical protein
MSLLIPRKPWLKQNYLLQLILRFVFLSFLDQVTNQRCFFDSKDKSIPDIKSISKSLFSNLVNLVICQLLKKFAKLKKYVSSRVCYFKLTKFLSLICICIRNLSLFFISFSPSHLAWRRYMRVEGSFPNLLVCQTVGVLVFLIFPKIHGCQVGFSNRWCSNVNC